MTDLGRSPYLSSGINERVNNGTVSTSGRPHKMRAFITKDGAIDIEPENSTELFALNKLHEEFKLIRIVFNLTDHAETVTKVKFADGHWVEKAK